MLIREIKVNRGIKERSDLLFLKGTNCPAVITEPLFLSHENSARLVLSEEFLDKVAMAIYTGIKEYLELER